VKIVLMVAAGVAVGLAVIVAMLIQVIERLAPLLLVVALVVLVLHLVRRRSGGQDRRIDQAFLFPSVPPMTAPVMAPGAPSVTGHPEAPYLRWGPPAHQDLDARPVTYGARTHVRRARAGAHPCCPVRGRRP
jgi:hypothetical protein